MKGFLWELSLGDFARVTPQNIKDEHDLIEDIVLSDWKTLQVLEYVYEELNILDKKLVQLLAFDGGILVANGVLVRMMEGQPVPYQCVVVASTLVAAVSTLLSAVPGIVWGTTWAMRHQEGNGYLAVGELKKAMVLELISRKLRRTKRYNLSVLLSTLAVILLISSLGFLLFIGLEFTGGGYY